MNLIECSRKELEPIQAILNEAILHTTALYDEEPRSREVMEAWFDEKEKNQFPILGFRDEAGAFMGFGTYGRFRPHAGYRFSIEHSVYVDAQFRGRGVGQRLVQELIQRARQQNYHMMIGVIDADNTASVSLHEKMGFRSCGHIQHAGFKFGRWLDLVLYQKVLKDAPLS